MLGLGCGWGKRYQALQGPKMSSLKTENSLDLTNFSRKAVFNKKKSNKIFSDIQGDKLLGAQGDPLPNRKKSPDLTHYFSKGGIC